MDITGEVKGTLNPNLMYIASWNIYTAQNFFSCVYDKFSNDGEDLGTELLYFKASPVRREDLEKVQDIETFSYGMCLVDGSLEDVTIRPVEQHLPIEYYILYPHLHSDNDRNKIERTERLIKIIKNKLRVAGLQFLKYVLPVFTKVTRLFQSEAPLVLTVWRTLNTVHHTTSSFPYP